jgi:hypothetical protein
VVSSDRQADQIPKGLLLLAGFGGVSLRVRHYKPERRLRQRAEDICTTGPVLPLIVDDLRSQGFTSVRAIADQLNERGILAPRGGGWHSTSAARLLSRLKRDGRRTDNGSPPRPGLPEKTSASCFRKSR